MIDQDDILASRRQFAGRMVVVMVERFIDAHMLNRPMTDLAH